MQTVEANPPGSLCFVKSSCDGPTLQPFTVLQLPRVLPFARRVHRAPMRVNTTSGTRSLFLLSSSDRLLHGRHPQ